MVSQNSDSAVRDTFRVVITNNPLATSTVSTTALLASALASVKEEREERRVVQYSIVSYSSYSTSHHPDNILISNPTDSNSRWTSGSTSASDQAYITLELEAPSTQLSITFGKYVKSHVCNLRSFMVYAGPTLENQTLILTAGLRNDTKAETFSLILNSVKLGIEVPIRYIRIHPLSTWGVDFNASIWSVNLLGHIAPPIVLQKYDKALENHAMRMTLHHLRRKGKMELYKQLQSSLQLALEHPVLTQLFSSLVERGDFIAAERACLQAESSWEDYVQRTDPSTVWKECAVGPSERGGHQLTFCSNTNEIFLFGGFSGVHELSDMWSFDPSSAVSGNGKGTWTYLSKDVTAAGGPSPRSCHKLIYVPSTHCLYTLGRFLPVDQRSLFLPDFWVYDIASASWGCISTDTGAEGGPSLIFDHCMLYHPQRHAIYVFGGKDLKTGQLSGMYVYHIHERRWAQLHCDVASRIGGSMCLLDDTLYVLGGIKEKTYLSDLWAFNLATNTTVCLSADYSIQGGPNAGFTQRCTYAPSLNALLIWSGLTKSSSSGKNESETGIYLYFIHRKKWRKILGKGGPLARYAHQLVHDGKDWFMFGGNQGTSPNCPSRLHDMWKLSIHVPSIQDVGRQVSLLIRQQAFRELCRRTDDASSLTALTYFRSSVMYLSKTNAEKKTSESLLASCLLSSDYNDHEDAFSEIWKERIATFEAISRFWSEKDRAPDCTYL